MNSKDTIIKNTDEIQHIEEKGVNKDIRNFMILRNMKGYVMGKSTKEKPQVNYVQTTLEKLVKRK